jgi:hypothetical protein
MADDTQVTDEHSIQQVSQSTSELSSKPTQDDQVDLF